MPATWVPCVQPLTEVLQFTPEPAAVLAVTPPGQTELDSAVVLE